ncbi:MAG: ferredoxin [Bacteroidia bacterium]|nr:ferredoxin [Bacteroidia bacterium]
MAIRKESELRQQSLMGVAGQMITAARTAPKAKGRDNLEIIVVDGQEKDALAGKMDELAQREAVIFFSRDADNLRNAGAIVLIGTRIRSLGLTFCGLCGYKNCEEKNNHPNTPCIFNTSDLGIAVGSAAAVAADHRVDNRIMYTAGMAALELGFFPSDVAIAFGIPLSISGKNPFFDRK